MTDAFRDSVVLVTGANGGLGEHFVRQALERGAQQVYASARRPKEWSDPRITPLRLDVTDRDSVRAAVAAAANTNVLVNNAGTGAPQSLLSDSSDDLRHVFETNFFGPIDVAQAFAPVLEQNGRGVLLNVLSILSWLGTGNGYSASKAALWSATNSLRLELQPRGVLVAGLHLGYTRTPMTQNLDLPMGSAADVVHVAYDGIDTGLFEILADDHSRELKAALSQGIEVMYPELNTAT